MPLIDPDPYTVLGVAPDATVKDVNLAVGKAVRAGRFTRQEINAAAALLRNPAKRLEADLQHHLPRAAAADADVPGTLAPAAAEPVLPDPSDIALPPPERLVMLRRREVQELWREPPPRPEAPLPSAPPDLDELLPPDLPAV